MKSPYRFFKYAGRTWSVKSRARIGDYKIKVEVIFARCHDEYIALTRDYDTGKVISSRIGTITTAIDEFFNLVDDSF